MALVLPRREGLLSVGPGQLLAAALIAVILLLFLIIPVATVIYVAFTEKGTGEFTLVNFVDFVRTDLFVRSFWNSIYVSAMSVVLASLFALPLATLTTRFEFRGALIIQTLGFIPLIMPPFVGAVAMQLLFGRNGTVNLLLDDWFGFKIPFMEGLNGVIFVQAVHYFPFILVNVSAALRNIDRSMEEAAQNLGCSGFRLFRRVVFPLALPGYLAGCKQGWAFSWRSLMAAEIIAAGPLLGFGLGAYLKQGSDFSNMPGVIAAIFLILIVGIGIELLVFRPLERRVLRARGLAS